LSLVRLLAFLATATLLALFVPPASAALPCDTTSACIYIPLLVAGERPGSSPVPLPTPTTEVPTEAPGEPVPSSPPLDLSSLSWITSTAEAPLRLFEGQGLAVGGRLYLLGGFTSGTTAITGSFAFDPDLDAWRALADLPEPLTHAGQTSDGKRIYLAGGFYGDSPGPSVASAWAYDIAADSWSALPPLPAARGGGALALLGRELHFFGGATRLDGKWIADHGDHWVLSLDGGTAWREAAPMPNPRNHIGGIALGGKIYAVGGQHLGQEGSGNQVAVDIYDPASDSWAPAADLPQPLSHVAASVLEASGKIVVVGGVTQKAAEVAGVWAYDPQTNTWSALASLPKPRQSPVAGLIGTKLYVATGEHKNSSYATLYVGELQLAEAR
jgi:hypothetical protein